MFSGEVYRGKLNEAEDNMNCQMSDVTVTLRDGRTQTLDAVFIRGSQIRFLILPDMLKNAPMFKVWDFLNLNWKIKILEFKNIGRAQRGGQGMGAGGVGVGGAPRGRGSAFRGGPGRGGRGRGGVPRGGGMPYRGWTQLMRGKAQHGELWMEMYSPLLFNLSFFKVDLNCFVFVFYSSHFIKQLKLFWK